MSLPAFNLMLGGLWVLMVAGYAAYLWALRRELMPTRDDLRGLIDGLADDFRQFLSRVGFNR